MFFHRKIKKAQPIGNENKENTVYDYPTPAASPAAPDESHTSDKIHVDTASGSTDKLLYAYPSSEASPRDLSSSSSPPKVSRRSMITNETSPVGETPSTNSCFVTNDYSLIN
jgi:hypothetical protein